MSHSLLPLGLLLESDIILPLGEVQIQGRLKIQTNSEDARNKRENILILHWSKF